MSTSSDTDYSSSEDEAKKPIVIPEFVPVPRQQHREDLSAFYAGTPPVEDLSGLSERELTERLNWCNQIKQRLSMYLRSQTDVLHAEWATKEQVLEQVLETETGADWKLP